jgi:hypothetical protein
VKKLSVSFTALKSRCRPGPTLARMIGEFAVQADKDQWSPAEILDAIREVASGEDYKAFADYCI